MNDLPTQILGFIGIGLLIIAIPALIVLISFSGEPAFECSHNPRNPFRRFNVRKLEDGSWIATNRKTGQVGTAEAFYEESSGPYVAKKAASE